MVVPSNLEKSLETYELALRRLGAVSKPYRVQGKLPTRVESLGHCLWLLPKILEYHRAGDVAACAGLLGWVEGVLWTQQVVSYDVLPPGS